MTTKRQKKKNKKKQLPKERNWVTVGAIQRKAGAHVDRKSNAISEPVEEKCESNKIILDKSFPPCYTIYINNETWRQHALQRFIHRKNPQ